MTSAEENRKARGIAKHQWGEVAIGVGVQAAFEPDQVTFLVSSDAWIVVAIVVLVTGGFSVVVLPR